MTVLLFTTTDLKSPRGDDYQRLLASITESVRAGIPLRHYVLLQNCTPAELERQRAAAPPFRHVDACEGRLSLSAARNRMMATACADQPARAEDIIGFPDDDCWFPDGFLGRLSVTFSERPALDLLICRVSLDPEASHFDAGAVAPAAASEVVRVSTSNNMFLRGSLYEEVGPFDPQLGLGTKAGGGEDTDYVIRAYLRATEAGIVDRALVGHPAPDRNSAAKYFRGALIVLARYAGSRPALTLEFLRKLLVGLYFIGRGKLTVETYRSALGDVARAWRGTHPAVA